MDKNERYRASGSNKIVSVTHYWVNASRERDAAGGRFQFRRVETPAEMSDCPSSQARDNAIKKFRFNCQIQICISPIKGLV